MANAYTIKETPEATDSITISDVTGQIFRATLGSLPGSSSAVGGYVDPPVYSDSDGIKGQYSFDTEYVYMCIADNSWDRFPVTWDAWATLTPEYPALLSATIDVTGLVLTLVFDKPLTQGAGYLDTDFNLDGSIGGADIGATYVSGNGTDTWSFSIATKVFKDEIVNLDYLGRVDGVEDSMGNDLGVILNGGATNDSEYTGVDYSDIIFWDGFDGILTGSDINGTITGPSTGSTYTSTISDYPASHTAVFESLSLGEIIETRIDIRKVGKALHIYSSTGGFNLTFVLPTPISKASGRIGFWSYNTAAGYAMLATLRDGITNSVLSIQNANAPSTGALVLRRWIEGGTYDPILANLTVPTTRVSTWVFLEVAWDHATFGTKVLMNGAATSYTSYTPTQEWTGAYDRLLIGALPTDVFGGGWGNAQVNTRTDNIMISTDPNRDLYALALLEAYPG